MGLPKVLVIMVGFGSSLSVAFPSSGEEPDFVLMSGKHKGKIFCKTLINLYFVAKQTFICKMKQNTALFHLRLCFIVLIS